MKAYFLNKAFANNFLLLCDFADSAQDQGIKHLYFEDELAVDFDEEQFFICRSLKKQPINNITRLINQDLLNQKEPICCYLDTDLEICEVRYFIVDEQAEFLSLALEHFDLPKNLEEFTKERLKEYVIRKNKKRIFH